MKQVNTFVKMFELTLIFLCTLLVEIK